MKTISKVITVAVLSGFMVGAFADSSNSPFSCQEQTAKGLRTGLNATKPFTCGTGSTLIQYGSGIQSGADCRGGQVAYAPNAVCEVSPEHWVTFSADRRICNGSASDCAVELY